MQQKKTKTTKFILVLGLSLALASCGSKNDYVGNIATVDGIPISSELYAKQLDYYQKFYISTYGEDYLDTDVERGRTYNDIIEDELIDSMVKDQVMLNDLNNHKIKLDDSKATELRNDLENSLGGRDSLKANIKAIGVSENDFNENLYRDSIRKLHYDFYLSNNDIKDSEILDFYNDNEIYHRQYKYNVLVFDDQKEASKVFEDINNSADFKKYLKKPAANYEIINSDFVYRDDDILSKAKVLEENEVSDIFEHDGKYMILSVNSYNDNENELLINVKDIYLKDSYEEYLNKLIKKSKIRLFV